jgi:hypothetical protein
MAKTASKNSMEMIDLFTEALLRDGDSDQSDPASEFALLDNSLIALIRTLSETLLPMEPSSNFVENLKEQLVGNPETALEYEDPPELMQGRWISTIMSMFTIIGIASRIIGAVVLVTAILRRRRRQTSPA